MIPAPEELTEQLSRRAVQIAQVIGPRKTGTALNSIIPFSQAGLVGIEMPAESAYLLDLSEGVKAHEMFDLAGRVIPIRNTNGTISFRKATVENIGKLKIITRSPKDGRIVDTSQREWYYPEKKGTEFMNIAIKRSINEWIKATKPEDIFRMMMKTEERENVSSVIYGRVI
jgi:hypothetical protein